MKFAMLAAAAVLVASFFVLETPAQEVIKSSGTVITTSDYVAQPARTGLFGRVRNRNNNISSASITTTAPATIAPASATATTPLTTTPLTPSTTVPMTTTTSSEPIPAQAEPRQGLFGRLRSRLVR